MNILNFINPIALIRKLYKMYRELTNYVFFVKKIKHLRSIGAFKLYGIKVSWRNRMYFVLNLQPELLLYYQGAELDSMEKTYVGNEIIKVDNLLAKHQMMDLSIWKHTRILNSDYYAYLLESRFYWREIGLAWIVWICTVFAGYGYLICKVFNMLSALGAFVSKVISIF